LESNQFQVFEKREKNQRNMSFGYLKKIKNREPLYMGISKDLKEPPGFVKEQGNFRDSY
jgi:hypothetical protein